MWVSYISGSKYPRDVSGGRVTLSDYIPSLIKGDLIIEKLGVGLMSDAQEEAVDIYAEQFFFVCAFKPYEIGTLHFAVAEK